MQSSGPSAQENRWGGDGERAGQAGWDCQLGLGNSTPCPLQAGSSHNSRTNKQTDRPVHSQVLGPSPISGHVDLAAQLVGRPCHMGSQLSICLSIYWPHQHLNPRCSQTEVGVGDPGDLDLGCLQGLRKPAHQPSCFLSVARAGDTLSKGRDKP